MYSVSMLIFYVNNTKKYFQDQNAVSQIKLQSVEYTMSIVYINLLPLTTGMGGGMMGGGMGGGMMGGMGGGMGGKRRKYSSFNY